MLTVSWDSTQTCYERDLEPTLADDAREACVRYPRALELCSTCSTAVLECVVVSQLADEGTCCNDSEANSEAPYEPTENRYDFVAE